MFLHVPIASIFCANVLVHVEVMQPMNAVCKLTFKRSRLAEQIVQRIVPVQYELESVGESGSRRH